MPTTVWLPGQNFVLRQTAPTSSNPTKEYGLIRSTRTVSLQRSVPEPNLVEEIVMSTQQVASRLSELCNKGDFEAAQKELFADDAVSIEMHATPDIPKETKGLRAIMEKGKKWSAGVEQMHSISASKPTVAGNAIAMTLAMDITLKGRGRMKMEELCVYTVKDDKITSEQFFM
jgi:hypothetical protein